MSRATEKRRGGLACQTTGQRTQAQQLAADQVFSLKVRKILDHRLRTPHRRYVPTDLVSVVAHWTVVPVGTAPVTQDEVALEVLAADDADTVPAAAPKSPKSPKSAKAAVNARALIVPGLQPEGEGDAASRRHVLRRMRILAARRAGAESVSAYGGVCPGGGKEADTVQALSRLVREQAGLDLSRVATWYKFLELKYREGPATVFFVPALWEAPAGLKALPQAKEEKQETEEQYEEEVTVEAAKPEKKEEEKKEEGEEKKEGDEEKKEGDEEKKEGDEEMKAEEAAETMTFTKFKTRKTETVTKTRTITPTLEQVAELVNLDVSKATAQDTLELCAAVDALDEFLKREMATRMADTLRKRTAEALRAAEEVKRLEDERQGRKRKREDEDEGRKKAREGELAKLREQWEDDDEGLTEEEKEEFAKERADKLAKMEEEQKKEDTEIGAKRTEEDSVFEKGPGGKDEVKAVVSTQYDAFAYFDRSPGFASITGTLPRLRMENVLLCTEEDLTLDELGKLMQPALENGQKGGLIAYQALATEALPAAAAAAKAEEKPAAETPAA